MDMSSKITRITIGIRHSRSFRISDIAGNLIDELLYSDDSPFDEKFFPIIQEDNRREKVLINSDTNDYLRINTDDIIMDIGCKDEFERKYKWITKHVIGYLENDLFRKYKVKNILRIGVIYHHEILKSANFDKIVQEFTKEKVNDVDNFSISFSKKLVSSNALINKSVQDYKNTIYNLASFEDKLLADLDYQHFFDPPTEDLRDCNTKLFFESARNFLTDNFYKWLSKYEHVKK